MMVGWLSTPDQRCFSTNSWGSALGQGTQQAALDAVQVAAGQHGEVGQVAVADLLVVHQPLPAIRGLQGGSHLLAPEDLAHRQNQLAWVLEDPVRPLLSLRESGEG